MTTHERVLLKFIGKNLTRWARVVGGLYTMSFHDRKPLDELRVRFSVGQPVEKYTGDYTLRGEVRAVFTKRDGRIRYAVEHEPGFIHIYAEQNLREVER